MTFRASIVALHGELDIVSAGVWLIRWWRQLAPPLEVDLSGVTFMVSGFIGALVLARNRILETDRANWC